jgi:hypothetical protein
MNLTGRPTWRHARLPQLTEEILLATHEKRRRADDILFEYEIAQQRVRIVQYRLGDRSAGD